MKRRYTYRLYPNKKQERAMFDIKGACQCLYNGLLEHRKGPRKNNMTVSRESEVF